MRSLFCEAMASPPRRQEREERRGLSVRTLGIASAASATAAVATSQLWIAGTWIAAAATPVIVAVVSELLHRPTERIAQAITDDNTGLLAEAAGAAPPPPPDADPLPDLAPAEPGSERQPARGPIHVYRQPPDRERRRLALGAIAATAAIAFLVAVALITVPELIAGQSIGKGNGRTSLFSGDRRQQPATDTDGQATPTDTTREQTTPEEEQQPTDTQPTETQPLEEQPTETVPEEQPTDTAPAPTTTQP
jgi:hypothetical protein